MVVHSRGHVDAPGQKGSRLRTPCAKMCATTAPLQCEEDADATCNAESDLPFLEVTSVSDLSEFDESQVEKIAVRPQATHVTFIVEKLPPSMEKSLTEKMLDGWKRQNGTGKHR